METQREYRRRLRRSPRGSRVFVRALAAALLAGLLLCTAYAALQGRAYGRAEDAYYHVADILAGGGEPAYDARIGGLDAVTDPTALGLSASPRWSDAVTVDGDGNVRASSQLCLPALSRLHIEIKAHFPDKGN